jgi:hypothetical protein
MREHARTTGATWCLAFLLSSIARYDAFSPLSICQRRHVRPEGWKITVGPDTQPRRSIACNEVQKTASFVCAHKPYLPGSNMPGGEEDECGKAEFETIIQRSRRLAMLTVLVTGITGAAGFAETAQSEAAGHLDSKATSGKLRPSLLQARDACKESWAMDWRSSGRGSFCLEPGGYLWRKMDDYIRNRQVSEGFLQMEQLYSKPFISYLGRFMLNFDDRFKLWWASRQEALPPGTRESDHQLLAEDLSDFIASVEYGLTGYQGSEGVERLAEELFEAYCLGQGSDGASRQQLAILFALQESSQPCLIIERCAMHEGVRTTPVGLREASGALDAWQVDAVNRVRSAKLSRRRGDLPPLLPSNIPLQRIANGFYSIAAPVKEDDFGMSSNVPVKRERHVGSAVYGVFALSGMVGCAGMHTLVVPLDVIKTREQVAPGRYSAGFAEGVKKLWREDGWPGISSGLTATVVGYSWYGMTVYPGYEFLKRLFIAMVGDSADRVYHVYLVILAGACSTAVACVGVCPAGESPSLLYIVGVKQA